MTTRAEYHQITQPICRVPDEIPNPSFAEAINIFKTFKESVELMSSQTRRNPSYYPVIIDGQQFILGSTKSGYVIQPLDDWQHSRKTGCFVSKVDGTSICDSKETTIEAVRKFARGIHAIGETSRFGSVNSIF